MSLEQLYRDNRSVYVTTIKRYVDCHDTAEDVVQEAFIKAMKSFPTYNPQKGSLRTWFNKVLFSVLWDLKRKNKRQPPLLDIDDFVMLVEERPDADVIFYLAKIKAVKNDKHRLILTSYYILGYKLDEICEMFDENKENLHKIIQRFKKLLVF